MKKNKMVKVPEKYLEDLENIAFAAYDLQSQFDVDPAMAEEEIWANHCEAKQVLGKVYDLKARDRQLQAEEE